MLNESNNSNSHQLKLTHSHPSLTSLNIVNTSKTTMFSSLILALCATLLVQGLKTTFSHDFPLGSAIENLVVRPSGAVLTTDNLKPHIFELSPTEGSDPKIIHTFPNAIGASGITATSSPDVYYVVTGHFNFTDLTPVPHTYAIHRVSIDRHSKVTSKELAPLDVGQSNGIIHVPNSPYVLIADSYKGFIYKFDTNTLKMTVYFDNEMVKPQPVQGITFGVNGLKFYGGYLYFSNTNRQFIARIKATGKEEQLQGAPEIVASQAPVDDFIIDEYNGDIYAALQSPLNGVGYLSHEKYGSVPQTIAGGPDSKDFLGTTAVTWAKGKHGRRPQNGRNDPRTLVVTVAGDFTQFVTGNFTQGGKVAMLHLDQC